MLHLLNNTVIRPDKGHKEGQPTYSDPATDDLLDMASLLGPRFKATFIERAHQNQSCSGDSVAAKAGNTKQKQSEIWVAFSKGQMFNILAQLASPIEMQLKLRSRATCRHWRLMVGQFNWSGGECTEPISQARQGSTFVILPLVPLQRGHSALVATL